MTPKVLKLKSIMEGSDMSIAYVSRVSGVSASTIGNWMDDASSPSVQKFDRVLSALGYKMRIMKKETP